MAKHRRGNESSGGEESPGHLGREPNRGAVSEQLPCLVVRATPDGYAVGRALIDAGAVTWVTPTHVRPWSETRPRDVMVPAVKQANLGGNVELKPARLVKGVPVMVTTGQHVVFGESMDAAAQRSKLELRKQFDAMVRGRRVFWRHLCASKVLDGLPTWLGTARGEVCPHCGAAEKVAPMKASAA